MLKSLKIKKVLITALSSDFFRETRIHFPLKIRQEPKQSNSKNLNFYV